MPLQLRLDFDIFAITGPSTSTDSFLTKFGLITNSGVTSTLASRCLVDRFVATGAAGGAADTICGTNTGQHSEDNTRTFDTFYVYVYSTL